MKHFGIISPPVSGHIHPMCALGRELIGRGHRVTYFQILDLEAKIRAEQVDFCPIGAADHPRGSLPRSLTRLTQLSGLAALRFTISAVARMTDMLCRDAPVALRTAGVDALLVDQMEPGGGAVADYLGLPFVTICNALPINRDRVAPPAFTPWRYREAWWAGFRNSVGYAISDWLTRPVTRAVATHRERWKLRPLRRPDDSFSQRAQISQMPRGFDFPRRSLPQPFHYVGPLRHAFGGSLDFPWEGLDGRPVVYASLGTLQNGREPLFRTFAEACSTLDVQLVLTHGGGLTEAESRALPGQPIVVSYAPQEAVLRRAAATLCHGGLNTVLDSLTCAVPIVAVPITFEQPAIGRRVEACGVGRCLPLQGLTAPGLAGALKEVLNNQQYGAACRQLAAEVKSAGGTRRAAEIVETAVRGAA